MWSMHRRARFLSSTSCSPLLQDVQARTWLNIKTHRLRSRRFIFLSMDVGSIYESSLSKAADDKPKGNAPGNA